LNKDSDGSSGESRQWALTLDTTSISFDPTLRESPEECTEDAVNAFFDSINGVVVVFDACRGVEPEHARTLLGPARRYKMPIIVFATAMDLLDADFVKVVGQIDAVLDGTAVPTQLPMGAEGNFDGIVDLIRMKASSGVDDQMIDDLETDVPGEMSSVVEEWRSKLVEAATAANGALTRMSIAGEEFSAMQLVVAVRQLTMSKSIMPTLVGTTSPDTGIEALLNAVCEYFPASSNAAPSPELEKKLPYFLVAKLQTTDPKHTENLRTCVATLARDGNYSVTVDGDLDVISVRGSNISHIEGLIDELRRTSTLDFSAEPTQVLKFEYPVLPVKNAEGKHETDQHHAHVLVDLFNFEDESNNGDHPQLRFENDAKNSIPAGYISTCENGFREACKAGPLTGYPITRMGMRLRFGSHSGDKLSADYFFQATAAAVRSAFEETEFTLLEPVMRLTAEVPEEYLSDFLADLGRRRGRIEGQEAVGDMARVVAQCPASELLDYGASVRSLTGGKGPVSMAFYGYEEVSG
jgi:translation elongation factor EF-G